MDDNNGMGKKPIDNSVKPENDSKAAGLMGFDSKNPPVQSEFNPETHWKENLVGTIRERQPDVPDRKPVGPQTADNRIKELIKTGELRGASNDDISKIRSLLRKGYTWEHLKDAQSKTGAKDMLTAIKGIYDEFNEHQQQGININDAILSFGDFLKEQENWKYPTNDELFNRFIAAIELTNLKHLSDLADKLRKGEEIDKEDYKLTLKGAKQMFKRANPRKPFTKEALLSMIENSRNFDVNDLFLQ